MCVIIMPLFSALHLFKGARLHFGLEAPPAPVSVCNCHQAAASPLLSSYPPPLLSSPLLSSLLLAPSSPLLLQHTITSVFPPCSNHSHLRSGSSCLSAALLLAFRFSQFSSLAPLTLIQFTKRWMRTRGSVVIQMMQAGTVLSLASEE